MGKKREISNNIEKIDHRSPIRQQYEQLKQQFTDGILLFRLGDFYETFDDDAIVLSQELDIALTSKQLGKGDRVPLAGIPVNSLNVSVSKLLSKGHRVAICEQIDGAEKKSGLIHREIVRIVSPGTIIEEELLPGKDNNFLASVYMENGRAGLSYVDISTSEFKTLELDSMDLQGELERISPAEIIYSDLGNIVSDQDLDDPKYTHISSGIYDLLKCEDILKEHFDTKTLEPYGCSDQPLAVIAAGSVLAYLKKNNNIFISQIKSLITVSLDETMRFDPHTVKTLELFEGINTKTKKGSLFGHLDNTKTPMGMRLLKEWIGHPLLNREDIQRRNLLVKWMLESGIRRSQIRKSLSRVPDLDRLVNRVVSGMANGREILALKEGLQEIGKIESVLLDDRGTNNYPDAAPFGSPNSFSKLIDYIASALVDDPPPNLGDDPTVRSGFSKELDEQRFHADNALKSIMQIEKEQRTTTGIPSLKVGYSRVFGYFLEITKSNLKKVPSTYIRKQTIANGERYFIPALKEEEEKISIANQYILDIEATLFSSIQNRITQESVDIMEASRFIAKLDVISSFGETAVLNRYTCPVIVDDSILDIKGGRHPVVEKMIPSPFVPNDTLLSSSEPLSVVTGPNMAGKSTYLRQVALLVILTQIGSYVPASSLSMGIVDRVFTRAGLQDDISNGLSTFMVEMMETAYILNHSTDKSLIILDEIGRGTSTYDGLSIAWSVLEHIHNEPKLRSRTLFATHYHELVEIVDSLPRASNVHIAVSEENGKIVFLRRVLPGGVNRSYGLNVAQIAGMPDTVIERGKEFLEMLENRGNAEYVSLLSHQPALFDVNPELNSEEKRVIEELKNISIDGMTPLGAINFIDEIKKRIDNSD